MELKTLNYGNGKFDINGFKFPNSFVKKHYPEYSLEDNVKFVYYQESSNRNKIAFKDGSEVELPTFDPNLEQLLNDSYKIYAHYNSYLDICKSKLQSDTMKAIADFQIESLFAYGLKEKDQDEIIAKLKELKPLIIVDNKYLLEALTSIKKKLLKASDFTQLPDVQEGYSETEKAAWVKYRAALRKLDKAKDPKKVRLPKPPSDID